MDIPVTVVMPENAPKIKVAKTLSHGARVVQHGITHDEQTQKVDEIVEKEGLVALHSFNLGDVIAGQGTAALESIEQVPEGKIGTFICPVGGGGLLSGCSKYLKHLNQGTKIIGAEPMNANDCFLSLKEGKLVRVDSPSSISDGLLANVLGDLNWPIIRDCVDSVQPVTDEDITKAMSILFREADLITEPSGAISVATLFSLDLAQLSGPIVCLLSGSNVDQDRFPEVFGS